MISVKRGFTMVELVMVIVIFGIIATIGAEIISKMYLNYVQARVVNYLQTQSEITLEQVAKRLQYRIKDTIIAKKDLFLHPMVIIFFLYQIAE